MLEHTTRSKTVGQCVADSLAFDHNCRRIDPLAKPYNKAEDTEIKLEARIPLGALHGRIDHLAVNLVSGRPLRRTPETVRRAAALLAMKTRTFDVPIGSTFAAWIGLTPKDHSTAGKVRLGVIAGTGDEGLRIVLAFGGTVVIRQARSRGA